MNFISRLYNQHYWVIEKVFILVFIIFTATCGYYLGILLYNIGYTEDIKQLDDYERYSLPTVLYDIHGNPYKEFHTRRRDIIPLYQVSPNIHKALIAYEDERFLEHNGVDLYSMLRALYINLIHFSIKEGGSTLTQQMVKWTLVDTDLQLSRTFQRKLREFWYALKVEKRFTKQEILERYLNSIELPRGADGFEAACQFYFKKSSKDVSLIEAAALVSTLSLPQSTDPLSNWDRVRSKATIIFEKLVSQNYASQNEIDAINLDHFHQNLYNEFALRKTRNIQEEKLDKAPYFSEYIFRQLKTIFASEELKEMPPINGGGYRIYTTLDLSQQQLAQDLLNEQLEKQDQIHWDNFKHFYQFAEKEKAELFDLIGLSYGNIQFNLNDQKTKRSLIQEAFAPQQDLFYLLGVNFTADNLSSLINDQRLTESSSTLDYPTKGAFVAMNPKNGYVTALIGGREFIKGKDEIIRAITARRQAGSSFKPFVYATALNSLRFTPGTVLLDEDSKLKVRNYDRLFRGPISLRSALKASVNVIAAKLLKYIHNNEESEYSSYLRQFYRSAPGKPKVDALTGMSSQSNVYQIASAMMGIEESRFPKDMDISVALGSVSVTPFEINKGMAVLANKGMDVDPISILRIYDRNGKLIKDFEAEHNEKTAKRILDPRVAYVMTDMLRSVTGEPGGTGYYAMRKEQLPFTVAGKTGTSSNNKDAWFTGYTPDMVCTVWVGFDTGCSLGGGQVGGNVAAPVWAKFMKSTVHENRWFEKPDGIVARAICTETGLLAGDHCPHPVIFESYIKGTEPVFFCRGIDYLQPNEETKNTVQDLLALLESDPKEDSLKKLLEENTDDPEKKDIISELLGIEGVDEKSSKDALSVDSSDPSKDGSNPSETGNPISKESKDPPVKSLREEANSNIKDTLNEIINGVNNHYPAPPKDKTHTEKESESKRPDPQEKRPKKNPAEAENREKSAHEKASLREKEILDEIIHKLIQEDHK